MSANTGPDEGHGDHRAGSRDEPRSWWSSPIGLVTLGFLGVAGYFLVTEHTAHLFSVLPWLLIAACPLMHLFMHHGHHGGHDHSGATAPDRGPEDKP